MNTIKFNQAEYNIDVISKMTESQFIDLHKNKTPETKLKEIYKAIREKQSASTGRQLVKKEEGAE